MVVGRAMNVFKVFFVLMIRRPPRSTQSRSSAASDVYKRQADDCARRGIKQVARFDILCGHIRPDGFVLWPFSPVSYTHLRAHETVLDLVCRLLLEKKKTHPLLDHLITPTIPRR